MTESRWDKTSHERTTDNTTIRPFHKNFPATELPTYADA